MVEALSPATSGCGVDPVRPGFVGGPLKTSLEGDGFERFTKEKKWFYRFTYRNMVGFP